jgi:hypothetical protein
LICTGSFHDGRTTGWLGRARWPAAGSAPFVHCWARVRRRSAASRSRRRPAVRRCSCCTAPATGRFADARLERRFKCVFMLFS